LNSPNRRENSTRASGTDRRRRAVRRHGSGGQTAIYGVLHVWSRAERMSCIKASNSASLPEADCTNDRRQPRCSLYLNDEFRPMFSGMDRLVRIGIARCRAKHRFQQLRGRVVLISPITVPVQQASIATWRSRLARNDTRPRRGRLLEAGPRDAFTVSRAVTTPRPEAKLGQRQSEATLAFGTQKDNDDSCTARRCCANQNVMEVTSWLPGSHRSTNGRYKAGNDENCTAHRCPNQNVMEVTSWLPGLCHVPACGGKRAGNPGVHILVYEGRGLSTGPLRFCLPVGFRLEARTLSIADALVRSAEWPPGPAP